jgi:hypothetical protein
VRPGNHVSAAADSCRCDSGRTTRRGARARAFHAECIRLTFGAMNRLFGMLGALMAMACPQHDLAASPLHMTNCVLRGNQLTFQAEGVRGQTILVQTSTNLTAWSSLLTNKGEISSIAVDWCREDARRYFRAMRVAETLTPGLITEPPPKTIQELSAYASDQLRHAGASPFWRCWVRGYRGHSRKRWSEVRRVPQRVPTRK